jgi:hypothetical protein
MTGKRGFSGKPPTPKARQAKRAAAIAGGNAKAGRTQPPATPHDDALEGSVEHSPALLAAFPELSGYPFPVPDSLALKDALEATLKQAKAHQAEVELEEAKAKLALTSGRQVPRSELDRTAATIRDAWATSARQIASDTLAKLAALPVEARQIIKGAVEEATAAAAERVAAALKAAK